MTLIRPEQPADVAAIHAVNCAAFPTDAEARLVDRLRERGHALISLVAEDADQVVGHILFSPVTIAGKTTGGLGLAPLAVVPNHQRRGIGGELIRAGLAACRALGCTFVVLLGHPQYYPRFGFVQASRMGLSNEYGADEAFQVIELQTGGVPASGGLVQFGPEFAEFG